MKFFTLKEANALLPQIKKQVAEILAWGKKLDQFSGNPSTIEANQEVETITSNIERLISELEKLGCFYKDWNFQVGLVDFPALLGEKEIFLCWRSDEAEILWYHDCEDGYAGRRPLPAEWLLADVFKEFEKDN